MFRTTVTQIFDLKDKNGDGKIDFQEILQFSIENNKLDPTDDEQVASLREMFQMADVNKDRKIDSEEYYQMAEMQAKQAMQAKAT